MVDGFTPQGGEWAPAFQFLLGCFLRYEIHHALTMSKEFQFLLGCFGKFRLDGDGRDDKISIPSRMLHYRDSTRRWKKKNFNSF